MPAALALEERRFDEYLQRLAFTVGHRDRHDPLRNYLIGLCLPGERKSIEPLAARVDPRHVSARHQSLHHFVTQAPWDDRALLRVARQEVLDQMDRHGGVMAWSVDDTGIPKKGSHSVGVARQYCGNLGKEDNCQVAVTLSLVNEMVSVPAAYRLYLPEAWANDRARRREAGVPENLSFRTKWEIGLEQVDELVTAGVPLAPVVADAGYGTAGEFREALTERGIPYVVGIQSTATLWPPGKAPLPAAKWKGRGRPPTLLRRDAEHRPLDALSLARSLPEEAWETVVWREGTKGVLSSRFARTRVRVAKRDFNRRTPRPSEWLLAEWPEGEKAPTKYWLSTMPEETSMEMLVRLAKVRWRIERDFEELKQEFGLDHFEGRGWRGFHHHATLCISAYGFLAAERARLSPPRPLAFLQAPRVSTQFHPRGSPRSTRTARQ
ncbi:MAG: IS701 family transposase [Thermoplasmata archaeon]